MGRVAVFLCFLCFFASLIAKLTMCTAVLQKDFLTVQRFCIYLLSFNSFVLQHSCAHREKITFPFF